MQHTATLHYDRSLIRHAWNTYLWSRLDWQLFVAVGLLVSILGYRYTTSGWGLLETILCSFLATIFVVFVGSYLYGLRSRYAFLARTASREVEWNFDENGITTESELGSMKLPWRTLATLTKTSRVWLLGGGEGAGYITLPAEQLTEEQRAFIEEQITRAQNKEPAAPRS